MTPLADLLRLIDGWRAALRAAGSDDYAAHRAGYERRAEGYALSSTTRLKPRGLQLALSAR